MNKQHLSLFLLALFFLLPLRIHYAQFKGVKISGNIFDKVTGSALDNVNIIISGTRWGITSGKDGYFTIQNLPPGNYELVASMVGYYNESRAFSTEDGDSIKLKLYMTPSVYKLSDIEILSTHPKEWSDNLVIFKKLFLGQTGFADLCKIENEYILNFTWKSDTLFAQANSPLIIENRSLGYKVKCFLNKFYWVKSEIKHFYDVNSYFTDLEPYSDREKDKWERNRKQAYIGSIEHFLYSLIKGNYMNEGFQIFFDFAHPTKNNSTLKSERTFRDKILKPSDVFNNQYILHFTNYLKVIYNTNEISWIKLDNVEILLDQWGYPTTTLPFIKMGHWGDYGIADLLPKYYNIEWHEFH